MRKTASSRNFKKDLEKVLKPSLFLLVCYTLILIGPYGNLLLDIANEDYNDLLLTALLSFPTLILLTYYWIRYFDKLKSYKKEVENILLDLKKIEDLKHRD